MIDSSAVAAEVCGADGALVVHVHAAVDAARDQAAAAYTPQNEDDGTGDVSDETRLGLRGRVDLRMATRADHVRWV